ncbi:MAG TPA: nucleotide exchange factor GrpE [Candidatus Paceibacterota bacterium]
MSDENDIDIEENGDENGENSCLEKLGKIKEKLKVCEAEKGDYLDGWQRSKADYANFKRVVLEGEKDLGIRATRRIIEELLPVLESLDQARAHTKDLEPIERQFVKILEANGLESYGEAGENFDPTIHESVGMSEVAEEENDNIIVEIVSRGYKLAGRILKPAKVKVGKYKI